ncbi:MAG: carboxypeptidase-like regulatory domain-containing protein [Gemmatimonadota bacterium]
MKRKMILSAVLAFLVVLAASAEVAAQNAVILRGRVMDAETAVPVPGALVRLEGSDRGVMSDSTGMFALPVDPAPRYVLHVTQLGYHDLKWPVGSAAPERVTALLLTKDPIELEGITVLSERLADRRRGIFGVADVMTQSELKEVSGGSGFDLLRRLLPFTEVCSVESEALCLPGRTNGGERRTVTVCIDGHRVPEPLMETTLSGIDPRRLYLVEAYQRAGQVRMYTPGYIKRLLGLGLDLPPLSFGCGDDRTPGPGINPDGWP